MPDYSKMSFAVLVDECMARGIKYDAKDTEETLIKKLKAKTTESDEPTV